MKTLKRCNFSIVEVIVVCAVIAILASLIMSSSSSIREAGKRTTCLNNLKQIQTVFEAYKKDHRKTPLVSESAGYKDFSFAKDYVSASDLGTFTCPGDENAIDLESHDDLVNTSYLYIPASPTTVQSNTEMMAIEQQALVIYDKSKVHHGGDLNIVYLHGSGNSKSGIAQTIKAGAFEWSIQEEELADNASEAEEAIGDNASVTEEATEENASTSEEQEALENAQKVLEELEEDLVEVSEAAEEAAEEAEEASDAAEQAEEAEAEAEVVAEEAEATQDQAQENLDEQVEALEEAIDAFENGPQEYSSDNIVLPEDNKGNEVVVNTDVRVTFELIGSGFSSNSIYSDVTVGSDTYKWEDEDGGAHTNHVVGVEGLTLDVDVETGLTIAINGRSSYYDSANLQGKSNLMVYRNGDVATSVGGYSGQDSVKTFLSSYIDSDGKVTIADNQVIFLMELGTTNTSKSYYDMQDLVVLATFDIVASEGDVSALENEVQKAKEALIAATTKANEANDQLLSAQEASSEADAVSKLAQAEAEVSAAAELAAENAVLAAEELEKELSNQN